MNDDCPFCARIKRGEYDYDDEYSVAFQPLNPVTPGHFLVVPRKHVATALEPLAPIVLGGAMRLAAILARQMDLTDCNFINSAGAAASQTVMHLHCHVVPRREGDGLALPWTGQAERDRLLKEALHLRQNGERAPGGNENWHDWDAKAERFLRGLLPPEPEEAGTESKETR